MKPISILPVVLTVFLVAACNSQAPLEVPEGLPEPTAQLPDEFVQGVRHDYFPLIHGRTLVFEGTADGEHRRDVVRTLADTRRILGVDCTEVFQEVYLDGELAEATSEWYAQDAGGNLWRFGEESYEIEDGEYLLTTDSWVAGIDGIEPWIMLGGSPAVGDQYAGFVPEGEDVYLVVSLSETADVPAGQFQNCLQAVENPDDPEDSDIILYAAGVGLVSEESPSGRIVLVSVTDG